MMTEVCDICKNTDETNRYITDGHEYNLCRKCLEDCERYMRGEER